MVADYHCHLNLRIDLIAKTNTINPATSKAAPASKLMPEFEPLIDNHIKMPRVIAAPEIINRAGTSIQTADTLQAFCRLDTLGSCHHLESPVCSAKVGHRELWQGAD